MSHIKKISVFVFSAFFCLSVASGFVFAQRNLEVPLPGLVETTLPLLPDYVKYIFNFAISISGLIAFFAVIYGGIRYLASAGSPTAAADAKGQIFAALLGIILLFSSYLILTTVNPQLIIISPQSQSSGFSSPIPPAAFGGSPGVYLCKNAGSPANSADCQLFLESKPALGALDEKAGYIRFNNPAGIQYGAVLHENKDYKGTCNIFVNDGAAALPSGKTSAITVFKLGDEGLGAKVYEGIKYEEGYKNLPVHSFGEEPYQNIHSLKYDNCQEDKYCLGDNCWVRRSCLLKDSISSVKIFNGSMAVLFEDENFRGRCAVFPGPSAIPSLATPVEPNVAVYSDTVSSIKILPTSP